LLSSERGRKLKHQFQQSENTPSFMLFLSYYSKAAQLAAEGNAPAHIKGCFS
jgi:hypothetical protein